MGAAASDYFTPYADVRYGFLDDELGIINLHALAAKGDFHRVSACLKKGLDPNRPSFDDDDAYAREDTSMICAARGNAVHRGRKRHIKTLDVLFRFGGDVNKHNCLEQTPLYIACEKNLTPIAQWLVAHGADVNKCTKVGVSPLLCAYRNGNADIVKLLLDHGAKVLDPPREFCSIQFPTIAKELRGENVDERRSSAFSASIEPSGRDDDDEPAPRPASSRLRTRPLWKTTKTPTESASSSSQLPALPTPAAPTPPVESAAERIRSDVEREHARQVRARDGVLADQDERRRIEEQRAYREKLATDNAKRKASRRRQRDKAQYDKYIARVEFKRREHAAAAAVAAAQALPRAYTAPVVLQWSPQTAPQNALEAQRRSLHTAPSRAGRPSWVPHQVYAAQAVASSARGGSGGDDRLLRESQAVFDTLEAQRERRERLRRAYGAAPLPPLGATSR